MVIIHCSCGHHLIVFFPTDEESSDHEPFVVRRPTDESEEFWLSVTKSQLVEKDIEGHITEMLDLSALLEVQKTQQVGEILPFVRTNFYLEGGLYCLKNYCLAEFKFKYRLI